MMTRHIRIIACAAFGLVGFAMAAACFAQNAAPTARVRQNSASPHVAAGAVQQSTTPQLATHEGDYVIHDFHFADGETMPELRLHYTTLGAPARDANGRVTNAVLILHGTGGTGHQFLGPTFAGVLFGAGQLLDAATHYIILPDDIGHGKSSKPSDGLHAQFPRYDYSDMVAGEFALVSEGLHVNHLRLVMGTSMGCMHSWMWGESHPDFMDALMPLACLPVEIAGRNRMTRKMIMDSIKSDPAWDGGNYKSEPINGLRAALDVEFLMVSAPLQWQKDNPTAAQADAYLQRRLDASLKNVDANDLLYAFDASRTYNPSPNLGTIKAYVMHVNSADDFVNPPELGIAEREIRKVPHGRFVLLPITDQTRGHGTHTLGAVWKNYLAEVLSESAH
jgi:homoserine O-acetyltransferase/O-succinyltransferase